MFKGRSIDAAPVVPPFRTFEREDAIAADQPVERCVVDNRVFLLGLDELYRVAVKQHEQSELLACARRVAAALHVAPADVPVEGYYAEAPELTDYFRLMRALQATGRDHAAAVAGLPEFRRLLAVCSAPLYGRPVYEDHLLPVGRDPLSQALQDNWPDWSVSRLTTAASAIARNTDDYSLVGLAARIKDPVVLAALRESVVLYFQMVFGRALLPPRREFVWQVDDDLARQARRFVDAFNALFSETLPRPMRKNAEVFWYAHKESRILGRCARLGQSTDGRHYHWGICSLPDGQLTVHEFWHDEIWTTTRYRGELHDGCPEL